MTTRICIEIEHIETWQYWVWLIGVAEKKSRFVAPMVSAFHRLRKFDGTYRYMYMYTKYSYVLTSPLAHACGTTVDPARRPAYCTCKHPISKLDISNLDISKVAISKVNISKVEYIFRG